MGSSDICGFRLPVGNVEWHPHEAEKWKHNGDWVVCSRSDWNNHGSCFWHASSTEKTSADIVAHKDQDSEKLDGAKFNDVKFDPGVSFATYHLSHAEFDNVRLLDGDFREANLEYASLTEATLRDTSFTNAELRRAKLKGADLRGTTCRGAYFGLANLSDVAMAGSDCSYANFGGGDLSGGHLLGATFRKARFVGTAMADIKAYSASFLGADFENATLPRANLNKANLIGAKLYNAVLQNVRISDRTQLGTRCYYDANFDLEKELEESGMEKMIDANEVTPIEPSSQVGPDPVIKAQQAYSQLESICLGNSFPDRARTYYFHRKEHRRQQYRETEPIRFAYETAAKYVTGYGDRPWWVVFTSLAVIVGFAGLYPIFGIQTSGSGQVITYWMSETGLWQVLWQSLYFSTVTFTTVGYGDVQPVIGAQPYAMVESFVGALLMALLVFVLGRRTTYG